MISVYKLDREPILNTLAKIVLVVILFLIADGIPLFCKVMEVPTMPLFKKLFGRSNEKKTELKPDRWGHIDLGQQARNERDKKRAEERREKGRGEPVRVRSR